MSDAALTNVEIEVDKAKQQAIKNVDAAINRGGKLAETEEQAARLQKQAQVFNKKATDVKVRLKFCPPCRVRLVCCVALVALVRLNECCCCATISVACCCTFYFIPLLLTSSFRFSLQWHYCFQEYQTLCKSDGSESRPFTLRTDVLLA